MQHYDDRRSISEFHEHHSDYHFMMKVRYLNISIISYYNNNYNTIYLLILICIILNIIISIMF